MLYVLFLYRALHTTVTLLRRLTLWVRYQRYTLNASADAPQRHFWMNAFILNVAAHSTNMRHAWAYLGQDNTGRHTGRASARAWIRFGPVLAYQTATTVPYAMPWAALRLHRACAAPALPCTARGLARRPPTCRLPPPVLCCLRVFQRKSARGT